MRIETVSAADLRPVGTRPPIGTYLRRLWQRRHFLWADARARSATSTRDAVLGQAWMILNPILTGLAYFLIFGIILDADRGIENYLGYLVVGIFLFRITSQCVASGARSIHSGRNLIRAFPFPRASLPVSVVLRAILNLIPTLCAMLLLIVVLPERETWTTAALLFPLVLVLQIVFVLGITLGLARLTTIYPDVNQVISLALRFWLYGSAVFFSIERFADWPQIMAIMQANPMYMVLDAARDCLLYATAPSSATWLGLFGWAFGALVVGFLFFWRGETTYGHP